MDIVYYKCNKKQLLLNKMEDFDLLEFAIAEIMYSEVYLRDVPYSLEDGAKELDSASVEYAAAKIVKYLRDEGLLNG